MRPAASRRILPQRSDPIRAPLDPFTSIIICYGAVTNFYPTTSTQELIRRPCRARWCHTPRSTGSVRQPIRTVSLSRLDVQVEMVGAVDVSAKDRLGAVGIAGQGSVEEFAVFFWERGVGGVVWVVWVGS